MAKKKQLVVVAQVVAATRNSIVVRLFQNCMKTLKRKNKVTGEDETYEKPVKHYVEFSDETTEKMTTEQISTFIVGALARHQILQKNQGKAAFDTSLPIEMEISVKGQNGEKTVESGIKMSTNVKALERILNQYPTVVSLVFNPQAFRIGASKTAVLNLVEGINQTVLPAIAVNEEGALVPVKKVRKPKAPKAAPVAEGQAVANELL